MRSRSIEAQDSQPSRVRAFAERVATSDPPGIQAQRSKIFGTSELGF